MTGATQESYVAKGAELLDRRTPTWDTEVAPEMLTGRDEGTILDLLYKDYVFGVHLLDLSTWEETELGFKPLDDSTRERYVQAWAHEIKVRTDNRLQITLNPGRKRKSRKIK